MLLFVKTKLQVLPSGDILIRVKLVQSQLAQIVLGGFQSLVVFRTQVFADYSHGQTENKARVQRVADSIKKGSHLGIESSVLWRQKITSLVETNVHTHVLETLRFKEVELNGGNQWNNVLVVADSQMANGPLSLQIDETLTESLVGQKGRRETDVGNHTTGEVVQCGETHRKERREGSTQRVARDLERKVLVCGQVEKLCLEHADDFLALALAATVGSLLGLPEEILVESLVDLSKGLLGALSVGRSVSGELAGYHKGIEIGEPITWIHCGSSKNHGDLLLFGADDDRPQTLVPESEGTIEVHRGSGEIVVNVIHIGFLATLNHVFDILSIPFGSTKPESELRIDEFIVANQIALDGDHVLGFVENIKVLRIQYSNQEKYC